MQELIINKDKDKEYILLTKNGKIIESYISDENDRKRRIEGNIYIGMVSDIINGMQAAFIDFGKNKKGLIHLKDVMPQIDETKQKVSNTEKISKYLKPQDKILIQIKKDSDEQKGARVSTHISLPGKYVVIMPKANFVTISQKISNEERKKELKLKVAKYINNRCGAVIRTSAENANIEDIKKEIDELLKKWNEIQKKYEDNKNNTNVLIYESLGIVEKFLIDIKESELDRIIVNDENMYNELNKICNTEIILENKKNLLNKYDINLQLEKIKNRKIWLNCGGFITIDKTEALTAIDVNSGKYTGKIDIENTIFKVNKEATIEIAKQLRLRDIGGIIIIDYIDMKNQGHKDFIQNLLQEELNKDRAKTQIEGFTKLNLMEMTRKHICSHLNK